MVCWVWGMGNGVGRMAAEYDLYPIYRQEFHEVYTEHSEHPEFGPLMERMKVVDKEGNSQMDEDQWDAASESSLPSSAFHLPSPFHPFLHPCIRVFGLRGVVRAVFDGHFCRFLRVRVLMPVPVTDIYIAFALEKRSS